MPCGSRRWIVVLLPLLLLHAVGVAVANPSVPDSTVAKQFEDGRTFRANGQFDAARDVFTTIIRQNPAPASVSRRAYNELVFTYFSQRNATTDTDVQQRLYDELVSYADTALTRFPDLSANPGEYPPEMDLIYDTRRALKFGRVEVIANLDSCRVLVNGDFVGLTPLVLPYAPVGDHELTVTRSGYKDRSRSFEVRPSGVVHIEVTLKQHTRSWWITRVVAPIAVGVGAVVALVIANDDEQTPAEEEPLSEPPPPPGQ